MEGGGGDGVLGEFSPPLPNFSEKIKTPSLGKNVPPSLNTEEVNNSNEKVTKKNSKNNCV